MEFISLPHDHGTNDCNDYLRKELNKQDRFTVAAKLQNSFLAILQNTHLLDFYAITKNVLLIFPLSYGNERSPAVFTPFAYLQRQRTYWKAEEREKRFIIKQEIQKIYRLLHRGMIEEVMEIACPEKTVKAAPLPLPKQ